MLGLGAYALGIDNHQLLPIVLLVNSYFCCQALIVSNASACAIEFFPNNSATAAAFIGATGFLFGAVSGGMVSIWGDGTPAPMAIIMLLCTMLGLAARKILHQRQTE